MEEEITELYDTYLKILRAQKQEPATLYFIEADDYYYAFNTAGYTVMNLFKTCMCQQVLKIDGRPSLAFYTAIPKYGYSTIIQKVRVMQLRCAFVTSLKPKFGSP